MNKPLRPTEAGPRRCLKCNEEFPSKGAGNRICKKCSRANAAFSMNEQQLLRQRGGKRLNGNLIEVKDSYEVNFH